MSDVGVGEWRRQALQHGAFLNEQIREAARLRSETEEHLEETIEARDAARVEAAMAFLPAFDPVSLEMCERLAGMKPGWAALQAKRVQDEDAALAARISQIERDDGFERRERLIGHEGEWTTALADAERALRPHQELVSKYEALPSFRELIETGYDTPEYSVRAYHFRYYRLWKHADEACEKMGQEPFALIRQLYLEERDRRDQKLRKHDEVKARVASLQRLVSEHATKVARREALRGPAPLAEARAQVGQWLGELDRRALCDHLQQAGRPDLLAALVKLDGIEAKSSYLQSILQDDLGRELEDERRKLESDLAKYARPKKAGARFAAASVQKRFHDRPERFRRRLEQRRALVGRLYEWDDYDAVPYDDWGSGTPWWFFISGRSDPGYGARFVDVSDWTTDNPGWTYVRSKRAPSATPMDDAAAALANERVDDGARDVS